VCCVWLSAAACPVGVVDVQGRVPSLMTAAVESEASEFSVFCFIFDVSSMGHYPNQDKKNDPRAGTRPSSPQTEKTAPGLATQGKRGLVAIFWFLFGLQRIRLAQERGCAVVGTSVSQ
jgi:hypothetical protein